MSNVLTAFLPLYTGEAARVFLPWGTHVLRRNVLIILKIQHRA